MLGGPPKLEGPPKTANSSHYDSTAASSNAFGAPAAIGAQPEKKKVKKSAMQLKREAAAAEAKAKATASWLQNQAAEKVNDRSFLPALADCEQALFLDKSNDAIWVTRGCGRRRLGDQLGAIDDFNKALEIDPNNRLTMSNRAAAKAALRDDKGCISDVNEALKMPTSLSTSYLRSASAITYAMRAASRYRLAIEPVRSHLLPCDNDAPFIRQMLVKASEDCDHALNLNSKDELAQKTQHAVLTSIDQFDAARQAEVVERNRKIGVNMEARMKAVRVAQMKKEREIQLNAYAKATKKHNRENKKKAAAEAVLNDNPSKVNIFGELVSKADQHSMRAQSAPAYGAW